MQCLVTGDVSVGNEAAQKSRVFDVGIMIGRELAPV